MNCRLKIKVENNKESFFSSTSELLEFTGQENTLGVLEHGAEGASLSENL